MTLQGSFGSISKVTSGSTRAISVGKTSAVCSGSRSPQGTHHKGGHISIRSDRGSAVKHPSVAMVAAVGSPNYCTWRGAGRIREKRNRALRLPSRSCSILPPLKYPERAAEPKRVNITASLPVTEGGKIFKPALQQRDHGECRPRRGGESRRDYCGSRRMIALAGRECGQDS